MAGTSETTASAILKKVYPGLIEDQLNRETALYARANKKKEAMVFGSGLVKSIRVNRSQGLGARAENATLPSAGYQGYAAPAVGVKRNYHVGQISGAIIRDSEADDAAFEDALAADTQYNILDLTNELDWQLFHGTGIRATVNGLVTAGNVTVTVDNPGTAWIGVGMAVDVYNSINAVVAKGLTVSSIVNSVSFVIGSASGTILPDNGNVFRAGNFDGTTLNELSGLQVIVDDGTSNSFSGSFYGLSRTTYPGLKSTMKASAGTLTETDMQSMIDGARQSGGGKIDLILTSYAARRQYAPLLTSNKRYPSPYSMSLEGGFKQAANMDQNTGSGLAFDDVEVVAAKNCAKDEMYFLDMGSFTFFEQSEVKWIENGGSVLHPLLAAQGLDAYQYSMFHEGEFYCDAPNRNAKLTGITVTGL
jgi:hypothetical protein